MPAILVLCYYCSETVCDQSPEVFRGAAGRWKRLALAGTALTLAVGSLAAIPEFQRAASRAGVFRYEQANNAITLPVPLDLMDQYIVLNIPNELRLLLDSDEFLLKDEKAGPSMQYYADIFHEDGPKLPGFSQPFSTDTLATLAAARRIARTEQEPVFVAAADYDETWVKMFFPNESEAQYIRTFDYKRSIIFPADHTSSGYLFPFDLPHASIVDRYFDEESAQIIGTSPSGRPITSHRLVRPRPPFEPRFPVPARFADQVFVYGFDMSEDVRAGAVLTVRWYWRLLATDEREFGFTNQVFGEDDLLRGQYDARGFAPGYWPAGTSGITTFEIDIDPETPTGAYWLRVAVYDRGSQEFSNLDVFDAQGNHAGNQLILGPFKVHGRPPAQSSDARVSSPPIPQNVLQTRFSDQIDLQGYSFAHDRLVPGGSLELTLFWSPRGRPSHDYTVFVHLLDSGGQLRGQADSPPKSGKYPTSVWDAGEVIDDPHTLSLAPDLPAGEYKIALGLYDPATGKRVQTVDENGKVLGDLVMISGLSVAGE